MTAIDLSALKNRPSAATENAPVEVETAFIVIIRGEGVVQCSPDINARIAPRREVTIDEMQMASRKVYDDIQADKTSALVQMGMRQVASQAYSAAEGQRIAQNLKI